jgi:hypothetical protein
MIQTMRILLTRHIDIEVVIPIILLPKISGIIIDTPQINFHQRCALKHDATANMPSKTKKAPEPAQSSQDDADVSMTDMPPVIPEEQLPFLEEQRIRIVNLPNHNPRNTRN